VIEQLDPVFLSQLQFGATTVYHFLFVPLTLGLVFVVAGFQTAWYRTAKVQYLYLTHFFGRIFLINFAMGVVTGIVQEFQFGMNWSEYSRFVGDIFGAPLAFEGLIAFFLEATFIGLWIFGWDKLKPGVHLATIWLTAVGTTLSAYFIIAANAFMQNPVGYEINEAKGRAELVDIGAVLTNPVAVAAWPHTIFGALMFAGAVVVAAAAWHLKRNQNYDTMRPALKAGAWVVIGAFAATVFFGDQLSLAMVAAQPMKMAAAEAQFDTMGPASFSLFTIGTPDGTSELFSVRIPHLLSILSTHTWDGEVEGLNDLQAQYSVLYGPDEYRPILWVTYWSFRWMIALGALSALIAVVGLWVTRKNKETGEPREPKPWMWTVAIWSAPLPMLAAIIGWIFTEMGRQPWLVFGLLKTRDGVSPGVTGLEVLISLALFTIVYGALAVVEFRLIRKAAQRQPEELVRIDAETGKPEPTATTVY